MSMASMMMSSFHTTAFLAPSLHFKTSYSPQNVRRWPTISWRQWRLCSLSIRNSYEKSGEESPLTRLDRRNMLIGLGGGLYGTALGLSHDQKAAADPVGPPNLYKCNLATYKDDMLFQCCPPYTTDPNLLENISYYEIPSGEPQRVRKAAHELTSDELSKFKLAISKMKELDKDDPLNPWSFMQQARIHCAHCNDAYDQVGYDKSCDRKNNMPLQVHSSWIFLPWHRWYLYFFERILGKLIGDSSFALPYWNYDNPEGMKFPDIYDDHESSLFDITRNNHACAGNYVDLHYGLDYSNSCKTTEQVIEGNLCYLNTVMYSATNCPELFIGEHVIAGESTLCKCAGSLENLHNVVHQWTGKPLQPHFNMGNFVTAARDPIFYGHHANVDRLWTIYWTEMMNKRFEPQSPDWLDATFIFYDENKKLVKVKVRDALDISKLGYSYTEMPLKWKDPKCRRIFPNHPPWPIPKDPVEEFGLVSKNLEKVPIRAWVKRPESSLRKSINEETVEILIIDGIEVEDTSSTRFDVYINTKNSTDIGTFAGSFITVAHGHQHERTADGCQDKCLKLGITSLVKELNAEDADGLVVTVVPRTGLARVGGVCIKFCIL